MASWRLTEPGAAAPAREVPGLPAPGPSVPTSLDNELNALPLVATPPDPASAAAAAQLRTLHVLDGPADRRAFLDVWSALSAAGADRATVDALGTRLLTDRSSATTAAEDASALQVDAALRALAGDRANGDRVNNAALAMYSLALAEVEGTPAPGVAPPASLLNHASTLLNTAAATFPDNRSVALDNALLARLPETFTGSVAPLPALSRWVSAHPQDRTARYLLAEELATGGSDSRMTGETSQTRSDVSGGDLATAEQALGPLMQEDPALGFAARGDAELAAADLLASSKPGAGLQQAWSALDDYDQALRRNADAGLYAGRAAALDAIAGNLLQRAANPGAEAHNAQLAAVEALGVAFARQPQSVPFALGLADLEGKVGDFAAMRDHARQALSSAATWQPTLSGLRITSSSRPASIFSGGGGARPHSDGDRGFEGYSLGSGRPQLPVWPLMGLGAGGYELTGGLIPTTRIRDLDVAERAGSPLDAGAAAALRADILLGDPDGAARDLAVWDRALASAAGVVPDLDTERAQTIRGYQAAAMLVTHGTVPAQGDPDVALMLASTTLRRAGRFTQAATVCERAGIRGLATDTAAAFQCAGESWYLAGRSYADRAEEDLSRARGEATQRSSQAPRISAIRATSPDEVALELAAVQMDHQPAQLDEARSNLTALATNRGGSWQTIAWKQIGDLALDAHNPTTAISAYDSAIASLSDSVIDTVRATAAARQAYVNRAVARLAQDRTGPDKPPCQRSTSACLAASADLERAIDQDPGDAVAHMDLAWVDRLLARGHDAREEEEAVMEGKKAVDLDPRLFPALGDLGIQEAENGDPEAARRHLEEAVGGAPMYDLGQWNLGALEMRDGPVDLVHHPLDPLLAQGHLARATQLNAALGAKQLEPDFTKDERIYQVSSSHSAVLIPYEATQAWTAAALGGFALLASLVGIGVREFGLRFAGEQVEKGKPSLAGRVDRALQGLALPSGRLVPWLVTVPVLVVLTIVSEILKAPLVGILWLLFGVGIGVAARELGHWFWARWERLTSTPAVWGWGFPLTLLLAVIPITGSVGPYVGHRVETSDSGQKVRGSLAGVLANVAVFGAALGLAVLVPLPAFRLIAVVQLGIIGWSLLPFEPLEGYVLLKKHPWLEMGIMAALVIVAVALGERSGWLIPPG